MRLMSKFKPMRFALLAAGVLALGIASADARPGGGGNSGSRGSKSFSAPPPTATVPRTAAPTQGMTQQGPRAATATPAGSRFGSGFGGLLMGGLLGAGLFGLLSGSGLFGGLSGLAGMIGLMLQVALIGGLIYLAMAFFRSRNQPAVAGGPVGMMNRESAARAAAYQSSAPTAPPAPPATSEIALVQGDYESFERLLAGIQDAYGREDVNALRKMATPDMVGHFADEIESNKRKNVHNLTSDAKLLQGDLSEAWGEEGYEYATVAMRYALLETTVERGTGRVLSGNSERPVEVTELWTFVRRAGSGDSGWQLSAIQQPG